MFKFLVLSIIMWQAIGEISSETTPDTSPPSLNGVPKMPDVDTRMAGLNGNYGFYLGNPMFHFPSPFPWRNSLGWAGNFNNFGMDVGSDYLVTNGIGAIKLHPRQLPWNKARRICTGEGGHLAVIRTEAEQKIIEQMMHDHSIEDAWLGIHDMFEEGEWISVLDEALGSTGWARWSTKFSPNPDNFQSKQHCARLVRDKDGMDDDNCEKAKAFICKITLR